MADSLVAGATSNPEVEVRVADPVKSTTSLHGRKEFATPLLMQILDIGTSDIVRIKDMKPNFIISIIQSEKQQIPKLSFFIDQNKFISQKN